MAPGNDTVGPSIGSSEARRPAAPGRRPSCGPVPGSGEPSSDGVSARLVGELRDRFRRRVRGGDPSHRLVADRRARRDRARSVGRLRSRWPSAPASMRQARAIGGRVAPPALGSRWAAASNRRIEPATAALSDPIAPRIGIRTTKSQRRRTAGDEALALAADDDRERPAQVRLAGGERRVGLGARRPAGRGRGGPTRAPGQVVDGAQEQVLDGARRGLDRGRAQRRLAVGREDDAVDAGRLGAPQERADVLGILERVEDEDERRLAALDGPGEDRRRASANAAARRRGRRPGGRRTRRAPSASRPRPRRSGSAGSSRGGRAARAPGGVAGRRAAGGPARRATNASSTGRRPATSELLPGTRGSAAAARASAPVVPRRPLGVGRKPAADRTGVVRRRGRGPAAGAVVGRPTGRHAGSYGAGRQGGRDPLGLDRRPGRGSLGRGATGAGATRSAIE